MDKEKPAWDWETDHAAHVAWNPLHTLPETGLGEEQHLWCVSVVGRLDRADVCFRDGCRITDWLDLDSTARVALLSI